ncbi:MAG TPA: alcohol dehydrogenase catalytic domain-containing protein, partial [Solirubrobacteraceae bacterium]|nr:alcohol dehydrogenase catalytic domain-containing protein [Solirubrobacteraceae bacterium]
MLAVYAASTNTEDPLAALEVGERPDPEPPDGWVTVDVRAASLNHHDLWSLRGVGLSEEALPMILGCDAAGALDQLRLAGLHARLDEQHPVGGPPRRRQARGLLERQSLRL